MQKVINQWTLQPFQNENKSVESMRNNYNKFYKKTCDPLHQINAERFIKEIHIMLNGKNKRKQKKLLQILKLKQQQKDEFTSVQLEQYYEEIESVQLNKILTHFEKRKSKLFDLKVLSLGMIDKPIELSEDFKKLLEIDGIFFSSQKQEGGIIIEESSSTDDDCESDKDVDFQGNKLSDRFALDNEILKSLNVFNKLDNNISKFKKNDTKIEKKNGKKQKKEKKSKKKSKKTASDCQSLRLYSQDSIGGGGRNFGNQTMNQSITEGIMGNLIHLRVKIPDDDQSQCFCHSIPDSFESFKDSEIPGKPEGLYLIDLFTLKLLAILMGRDSISSKEDMLFDMILGEKAKRAKVNFIYTDNPRLKRAVKKLLFFSEIMPKIHYKDYNIILNSDSNNKNQDFNDDKSNHDGALTDHSSKGSRQLMNDKEFREFEMDSQGDFIKQKEEIIEKKVKRSKKYIENEPSWSAQDIKEIQFFFKMNFDGIYEQNYLPRIFPKDVKKMNKSEYIKHISKKQQKHLLLNMEELRKEFWNQYENYRQQQANIELAKDFFTY